MGLLMKPTAGQIRICGEDVTAMGEDKLPGLRLQHIGFIFQTFNLFPALSAYENVKLVLKLKGYGWIERGTEARKLLERVGLASCMHRKPGELSGGQRQRICIARALAGDSDIILADEPTAALDTATGISIIELLRNEARTGRKAVLVVTHDPRLEKYATRVDRITDGVLTCGIPMKSTPRCKHRRRGHFDRKRPPRRHSRSRRRRVLASKQFANHGTRISRIFAKTTKTVEFISGRSRGFRCFKISFFANFCVPCSEQPVNDSMKNR